MKAKLFLFAIAIMTLFAACEKDSRKVDKYIREMKDGNYDDFSIPKFEPSDIPALLQYADDKTLVTNFPRNLISSLMIERCHVGTIALWTIESIRKCELNDCENKYDRFPSLNPIVHWRDPKMSSIPNSEAILPELKQIYTDWWNSDTIFKNLMKTDPLEDSLYKW